MVGCSKLGGDGDGFRSTVVGIRCMLRAVPQLYYHIVT